jgi:hypothetical protein
MEHAHPHEHTGEQNGEAPRIIDKRGQQRVVTDQGPPVDTLTEEQLAAIRGHVETDQRTAPRRQLQTAFLVLLDFDGIATASSDLSLISDMDLAREATLNDMYLGAAMVQKDIQGGEIATRVIMQLQAHAQVAQNAQVAQRLGRVR